MTYLDTVSRQNAGGEPRRPLSPTSSEGLREGMRQAENEPNAYPADYNVGGQLSIGGGGRSGLSAEEMGAAKAGRTMGELASSDPRTSARKPTRKSKKAEKQKSGKRRPATGQKNFRRGGR